ncbi:MAG: nitrous oxide reductase accessory protein NosL [bacterium]|nr:nitrous oxide reductase accessory protein NosL [bacterium]
MQKYGIIFFFTLMNLSLSFGKDDGDFSPPDYLIQNGKCFVSGLAANSYQPWLVCHQAADGSWTVFVGVRNFLEFVHFSEKYVGKPVKHSGDIWVRDYASKKKTWINALFAYYVIGDKIIGPDGKREAIPFAKKEDAENFSRKNGGKGVLRFVDLKRSVLKYLNGLEADSTDQDFIIVPKVIEVKQPK